MLKMHLTWYHDSMLIRNWIRKFYALLTKFFWISVFLFLAAGSNVFLGGPLDQVRRYTRQDEFEFVGWTMDALGLKVGQYSLGVSSRLRAEDRKSLVLGYFDLLGQAQQLEQQLETILANPDQEDQDLKAQKLRTDLSVARSKLEAYQPVVESILQEQVSSVLAEAGLGAGGKIFPPVSFEFTQLPLALIVSPRDEIRQEANIPLIPSLTLDEKIALENEVANHLDVSTLVVNIGGIGIYPTMVLESTSIRWVVQTIVHEWTHNYLTLRPLGLNYETSPELRTMNETVASLIGNELGDQVLGQYYPEFAPPEETAPSETSTPPTNEPPAFDFQAEMHETRIKVDDLLAKGLVEQAETYMEERRQVFWENGYHIRKLNQAYFAFYGAYAESPQGPAGEDPVGDAVRKFWDQLDSPVEFLFRMSWMSSFSNLQKAVKEGSTS
jgi:hypothetical protein